MLDSRSVGNPKPQPGWPLPVSDERGVVMLTIMMVLILLTAIGVAATTMSGLENNMAGLQRTMETSAQAAESCLGVGANVILQVMLPENGLQIPVSLLDSFSPPGPVPAGNKTILEGEIFGSPANSIDVAFGVGPTGATAVPNIRMTVDNYSVVGDIDHLFIVRAKGNSQAMQNKYVDAGGGAATGDQKLYRITCIATNAATGTESRVSAIYACSSTGDGCLKQ